MEINFENIQTDIKKANKRIKEYLWIKRYFFKIKEN